MSETAPETVRFRTEDGVRLAADVFNGASTAPTVIFMHGGGQTRFSWRRAAQEAAARGYRVISLDLRGHGASDWSVDGDYKLPAYVRDFISLREHFGERPILVGASRGGAIALACAEDVNARAIVLVDLTPEIEPEGAARIRVFMRASAKGFATAADAANALAAYAERPAPDPEKLKLGMRTGEDGRLYWAWDPGMASDEHINPDAEVPALNAAAERVRCPALLVRGASSNMVTARTTGLLKAHMPSLRVVVLDEVGHMVSGQSNTAFAREIFKFLDEVAPPR